MEAIDWNDPDLQFPTVRLNYKGKPIWNEISSEVISLTFTEHLEDKADEIQLEFKNDHGKWFDQWFPDHGDELEGWLGFKGGKEIYMGKFSLDQPNARGSRSGDTFTIRGQSLQVKKANKTKKTKSFEKQSLKQITQKVASEHGYSIVGNPPAINFEHVNQRRKTDIEFLAQLADEWGAFFSVKYDRLVFMDREEAMKREPVRTISKGERAIISYDLKHDAEKTYSKAKLSYFDGHQKKEIEGEAEDKEVKTGNTLKLDDRATDAAKAKRKAKSALKKANMKGWTGNFTMVGDPVLCAGNTFKLAGFGRWNRKYIITSARHHFSRAGYTITKDFKDAR